ncbi:NUDIX domain-containing protein [Nonomuraea sp. NPDC046802]|uniref:NUDIX domain-containing protein n=1 Tax=Nonomuraea sp. NPDC046802 TaxID=3154919 RepID=UPI0033C9BBC3
MGLDLNLVPDVVKPLALPLTGGAFPETDVDGVIAEAQTLEKLADFLAELKAEDAGAIVRMLRGQEWQGAAKEAFEQTFAALGGQPGAASEEALLDLLEQALRDEVEALRTHGVRMQHTEWMIYASLALLGAAIVKLLVWIYVNGPAVLRLIHHHTLLTQMNIRTIKRLVLINMLKFTAIMGGLDVGVQGAQMFWGDRERWDVDLASLAMSAGSGALTGALFGGAHAGLSRLLTGRMVYLGSPAELAVRDRIVAMGQSMYGQALLGGVAGTAGAVPGLALSGQLDGSHLAYTFISGVAGGVGLPAVARAPHYTPMRAVAELGDTPPAASPHADTDPPPPSGPPYSDTPPAANAHTDTDPLPPSSPAPRALPHDAPHNPSSDPQHNSPRDAPHNPSPDPQHNSPRDTSHNPPADPPRDASHNPPPDPPRDASHNPPADPPRDASHNPPPDPPRDAPRDLLRDPPPGDSVSAARPDATALADHPRADPVRPPEPGTTHPEPHSGRVIVGEVTRRVDTPLPETPGGRAEHGETPVRPTQHLPAERAPLGEATRAAPALDGGRSGSGQAASPGSLPRTSLLPATVPATISPPTDTAEQNSRQTAPETATQERPRQPSTDAPAPQQDRPRQPSADAPTPRQAEPEARSSTGHEDRAGDAASVRPHAPEQGDQPSPGAARTDAQSDLSASRSSALPENPRRVEPAVRRVTDLLSRDGAYDPISVAAWEAARSNAVNRLMETMRSSTKDLLGAGRNRDLGSRLGDPEFDLVQSELDVLGRTSRTWHAVNDIPSFVKSSRRYANSDYRIIQQMPFDSQEAHQTARRLAVEELVRSWGYGATEMLPERLAMHLAARDEFGLTGVLDLGTYGDPSRNRTARQVYARRGDVLRDFLRQQYEETQRELRHYGVEELVLYRGMTFDRYRPIPRLADAANGDVVQAPPGLPLQSWSAIPGVAKGYTGLGDGAVMAAVLPASWVLSTPWTGMGGLHEFVLLAGPGEVKVLRPSYVVETDSDIPPGWQVRKPGDEWTHCEQGHRHWGSGGGSGLLGYHRAPGGEVYVLMQLRSAGTHHGGTWGLPGGARQSGEPPIDAALREATEENRLDPREVNVRGVYHDDHGGWAFDTVIGEMSHLTDVWPASPESLDNAWVPLEEVPRRNLHPDLARAWPELRAELERILAATATPETARPHPAAPQPTGPARPRPAGPHQVPGLPDDEFSPIADPRPRNFAEAAAIVHRWNPDSGGGPENRIERLLNGSRDSSPPAVPDE